jgi:hypothetical protein
MRNGKDRREEAEKGKHNPRELQHLAEADEAQLIAVEFL